MLLWSIMVSTDCALAETIMEASTEEVTAAEVTPPQALVDAILATVDRNDLASFSACVQSIGIRQHETSAFFRAVHLPTVSSEEELYFVRPALKPYCQTFYGAHLFRYWIIKRNKNRDHSSYEVRYAGVADAIKVLSSQHLEYPDIDEKNCWAVGCGTVTLQYDGARYVAVKCTETTDNKDGSESTKRVPCPKAHSDNPRHR